MTIHVIFLHHDTLRSSKFHMYLCTHDCYTRSSVILFRIWQKTFQALRRLTECCVGDYLGGMIHDTYFEKTYFEEFFKFEIDV